VTLPISQNQKDVAEGLICNFDLLLETVTSKVSCLWHLILLSILLFYNSYDENVRGRNFTV
jgi:hypothetical protein